MSGSRSSPPACSAGSRFAFGCASARCTTDGQFLQIERLGQIVERAAFGRRDRRQDRVLRAHHDHRKLGTDALDARNQIEAVFVRQNDVGDDEVAVAGRNPAPEARRGSRRAHVIARAAERLVEHGADRRVVVADQDRSGGHVSFPRSHRPPWAAGCGISCGAEWNRIR